ncbi:hypothetical protein SLEP1_g3035 [Rubroshorea leprosula]|uniref:DDE Tnp4 domain-containing protein n=1 Tax=Rubroshorea leprosula TaxID=152421 RepID=A0AAV5HSU2_9ROSI|nr:hypothetical protein SLEP1_g3035 [Rubroshorea leprosula]
MFDTIVVVGETAWISAVGPIPPKQQNVGFEDAIDLEEGNGDSDEMDLDPRWNYENSDECEVEEENSDEDEMEEQAIEQREKQVEGWPGSTHDARVFTHILENHKNVFPYPLDGKYYLIDAGYLNINGYFTPYKGERKAAGFALLPPPSVAGCCWVEVPIFSCGPWKPPQFFPSTLPHTASSSFAS